MSRFYKPGQPSPSKYVEQTGPRGGDIPNAAPVEVGKGNTLPPTDQKGNKYRSVPGPKK